MKPVGKVSAISQTTQRIMKRGRRSSAKNRTKKAIVTNLDEESRQPDGKDTDTLQQQKPKQQRRKRRKVVYDSGSSSPEVKEEDEDAKFFGSEDSADGRDDTAHSTRAASRTCAGIGVTPTSSGVVDYHTDGGHTNNKKKDNSFKCPFCEHKSGRPNNLVIHINSKHVDENPPRTCSQDPAESIGESILYFLSTKKEFEEKIARFEAQSSLCQQTLRDVLAELTPEQKDNLRNKADKQQNRYLSNLLGSP